jgi:hypothetical protein
MIDMALKLGLPEPVETYSSSEHLFEIMKIPAGSTGRMDKPRKAAPAPAREKSEKSEKSESAAPARQKRERVRTKKFSS